MFGFIHMIGQNPGLGPEVSGQYNPVLVALSVLAACFAAYASTAVVERMQGATTGRARILWHAIGALTLGVGIWSMHFTGMLAFLLPFKVKYSIGLTAASIVPATLGSAAALHYLASRDHTFRRLQVAALTLALGIGLMHYTGMDAMRMSAYMRYDATLFVGSIVAAHVLATLALYSRQVFKDSRTIGGGIGRLASALLMGVTVSGMHYSAMHAAHFYITKKTTLLLDPSSVSSVALATSVTFLFGIVGALTLIGALIDKRLANISRSLDDSRARNEAILNQMQDGLITVERGGRIVGMNPMAETLFAMAADEAEGFDINVLLPRLDQEESRGLRTDTYRTEAFRSDGFIFPVDVSVNLLTLREGELYSVFIRDQSASIEMETQLRQAQKLESIGQLAAGIAHEINTPVQFVSDNTVFLQRAFNALVDAVDAATRLIEDVRQGVATPTSADAVADVFARARLDFVRGNVPRALEQSLDGLTRVARIVSAMKEFSHPSQGIKEPIDLAQAIEMTVTVARNEWKYVCDVEADFAENLPPVPCLRDEFNQVILNMIVNAAHAIREALGEESEKKGTITITTRKEAGWAVISIADTGAGIPDQVLPKIFDPFFTTKEVGKGTGQGLAIARNVIVEKHGGRIDVESRPGSGSTFTLRIPLTEPESSLSREAA
ncbi:MAG: PAS domain S-box protein [Pseudomonadales bacterium]|nr:PAS domain S-box protein [Pseudomonadales bacterium]